MICKSTWFWSIQAQQKEDDGIKEDDISDDNNTDEDKIDEEKTKIEIHLRNSQYFLLQ